ncbi:MULTISPECIES: alkaline phosphatase D family protein [Gordonia]|uniref:Alkaline phosphatase D family protein n=1 Tax=Gordonia amicalis TaxID=89053 RepID=A0ABU4D881_9ACTN|nr:MULTISPECIES: alkaline phosphatase D family protein [Gordonia]MBA5848675.1 alkaline phosphatase D family protein [Gordonia amicalis]MDV6305932.1 alkaline phosphatase D family protein [Gordonia amicalis]MDV7098781.1 alkaline phosphatase D family protein [Gordonia amicalis]MDV7172127.1 alkaline phosphatase D family protein [Gordonia amicalis]NKX78991.1 alkaline phosphatase [Gordonia amicalis]
MSTRHESTRRTFLRTGAVVTGAALTLPAVSDPGPAEAAPPRAFAHGVASGDPLPDAVILWTRITQSAASTPGSGVGQPCSVRWEIARDAGFGAVVGSGVVQTSAERDFTVKVDATGLSPRTTYHYRFTVTSGPVAGATSPIGTARTAPATGADVARIRFGVVSCANWEAGYFAAYRHLNNQPDLDAVVHLGDYYYEYQTGRYTGKTGAVRIHDPRHEIRTLRDYRTRHGQYKTDPDLAALHRSTPFICIWDDHESSNDSWREGAENHQPGEGSWQVRRAAALRAYSEWMPIRPGVDPQGRHLFRRLRFGKLLELSMLDLRSYRDLQVSAVSSRIDAPSRTMLGRAQMSWLTNGLTSSETRWKIVGNPVMISPVLIPPLDPQTTGAVTELLGIPEEGIPYNADQWDGYAADRRRLLDSIRNNGVDNVVFITGDIHSSWACDIPVDVANYPGAGTVATELVGTSVTSTNIDEMFNVPENTAGPTIAAAFSAANHHIRYCELDSHGYSVLTVTPSATQMDWYFLNDKTDPRSGQFYAKSFRVRSGTQRVQPVGRPAV